MNYFDDPQFLRQIIMDHYENPRNKRTEADYPHARVSTDSCIDDLTIQVKIVNDVIEDICFDGQACTIATSSASIMTELLKGKTIEEAEAIIAEFNRMVHLESYNEELLQEAVAFKNVGRQANRITCATLGWRGAVKIIEEGHESDV
ncbi:SUF system NifU family Fe-S cluster assembly protein [Erysipelothrix inopinata]|uniref:SUF system NifU family Fe-S cluster assembly protein n=1 Tax=Erysipelothrix inopinata TaxID=225084 RepID=A0A7G9RYE5_9FIRM|nr:SUF system NifU family Fe-S cluster assembly protein [Erysipelothrix inopinata]QNN60620.1 SUF system NifU family Fe-S cluster assembly protein [Erysipelothrix inopinata]